MDKSKELKLTGVKKYKRRTGQIEINLDWLHDWILALAKFVTHLWKIYNNEEVGQNIIVKQDIDSK